MAITTVKKSKLGYEDILFDVMGTGATTETLKSDGTYRTVQKVNASHLPITSTARAKKFADGTTVSTTDVDATLVQILDDLEDLGQPDGTTLSVVAGALGILAVPAGKLASNSVVTANITALNVTNAKLALQEAVQGSGSGTTGANVIKAKSIDTAELDDDAVTGDKIAHATVTNDNIANATIKAAKFADVPPRYIVLCGEYSYAGGAGPVAASISGVQTTDYVLMSAKSMANAVYLKSASPTAADTVTITFSGDPGASVFSYLVLRAVTA